MLAADRSAAASRKAWLAGLVGCSKVASKVAATVTGKPQNVGVFLELYRGYVADALYHDVSQRGSNDQHPLKDILERSIL